jgi:very-short-patch-repair endonuclease
MKADPRIRTFAKSMRREMTSAETILWSHLRGRKRGGWQFRRQHPVGLYILDFACVRARLGIEVDGATHAEDSEIRRDRNRDAALKAQGWDVLRVQNEDVYKHLDGVLDQIDDRLRFAAVTGGWDA